MIKTKMANCYNWVLHDVTRLLDVRLSDIKKKIRVSQNLLIKCY